MSETSPGEVNASTVISLISSGAYPRDLILTIARGFLPLGQDDLIAVLAWLTASEDPEIASTARAGLAEVPARNLFAFASSETVEPAHLVALLNATTESALVEALIRNRSIPDSVVADIARRAEPRVQEVIVINQSRILRAPEILDALLENPALSGEARRRALENREEFFEKRARVEAAQAAIAEAKLAEEEGPEILDLPLEPIADLLEKAETEPQPEAVPLPPPDDLAKRPIWARLGSMSVSEKVQLAFKGDRTIRLLLVRERNKLICTSVMRNPRMSETEVESIAGMRNVEDEVLRQISLRREWMSKYNILVTLCRNPKVPVGVVLPLINRLTLRDLKGLKDDKGVSQIVRETAKRFYLSRTQRSG